MLPGSISIGSRVSRQNYFETDFTEYNVGEAAGDWECIFPGNVPNVIVTQNGRPCLRVAKSDVLAAGQSDGVFIYRWKKVPIGWTNYEVLALYRTQAASNGGVFGGIVGSVDTRHEIGLVTTPWNYVLAHAMDGSATNQRASFMGHTVDDVNQPLSNVVWRSRTTTVWWWMRMRVENGIGRSKQWALSATEPTGWVIDNYNVSTLTRIGGYIGLGKMVRAAAGVGTDPAFYDFGFFSVQRL